MIPSTFKLANSHSFPVRLKVVFTFGQNVAASSFLANLKVWQALHFEGCRVKGHSLAQNNIIL